MLIFLPFDVENIARGDPNGIPEKNVLKVMKSQNECMNSLHCPRYEKNIRDIFTLDDYKIRYVGLSKYILYVFTQSNFLSTWYI